MNWYPLLALLAFAYTGVVFWLTIKKPENSGVFPKYSGLSKAWENGELKFSFIFSVWLLPP